MKKSFLLFILVTSLSYFTVFAQPVLTSSTAPKVGDIISNTVIYAWDIISPGPSGANQTWDFSNVTRTGISTGTYVNSHSSYYPSANLAFTDSAADNFFHIDSGEIDYLGGGGVGAYASYSNGEKLLSFPFTYNDAYTDTFSGTGTGTYPFNCWGYVKVKADAYGTLKTPAGTFQNVLRVSVRQISSDTFPDLGYGSDFATQSYSWYVDGFNRPLFQLAFDTTYVKGIVEPYPSGYYSNNWPAGVKNVSGEEDISIYPNPAQNELTINVTNNITPQQIIIANAIGQTVLSITSQKPITQINISTLATGIYFIKTRLSNGNVQVNKFVKQ